MERRRGDRNSKRTIWQTGAYEIFWRVPSSLAAQFFDWAIARQGRGLAGVGPALVLIAFLGMVLANACLIVGPCHFCDLARRGQEVCLGQWLEVEYWKFIFATVAVGFGLQGSLIVMAAVRSPQRFFNRRFAGIPDALLRAIIRLLLYVNFGEGTVAAQKAQEVAAVIARYLGLRAQEQKKIIPILEAGIDARGVERAGDSILRHPQTSLSSCLIILGLLRDLTQELGDTTAAQRQRLHQVAEQLGMHKQHARFEQKTADTVQGPQSPPDPNDPYVFLGCTRSSSAAELRKKYRRMCKKLHPDTAAARKLSENQIAATASRFKILQEKWSRICAERPDVH